jgi:hypothetical protein
MVVWEYDWELSLWMSGSLVSWDQQWHRWYPDRNQARYGYDSVRFHHPESPYWGAIVNGTRTKQIFGMVYDCYICFITMAPLSTGKKNYSCGWNPDGTSKVYMTCLHDICPRNPSWHILFSSWLCWTSSWQHLSQHVNKCQVPSWSYGFILYVC